MRRVWASGPRPPPPRYEGPARATWSAEQAEIANEILRSRPRTGLRGPFGPWLVQPRLARALQELGRVCRYETTLPSRESELLVLMTARHHRSVAEWRIHEAEALRAGLAPAEVAALKRGRALGPGADRRLVALQRLASEVLGRSRVSDTAYREAVRVLGGEQPVVEALSIVGYYGIVAYTLNVFRLRP